MAGMGTTAFLCFLFFGLSSGCQPKKAHHIFGQENAVWVESIYFRGYRPSTGHKLTNKHIEQLAHKLKNNGIKYAYIFAGPYQEDGHLPNYAFSDTARRSVQLIKALYPELVILPWLGGVQDKTVNLGDSIWRDNAIADTKKLIDTLNVSGVHIDFEYILRGEPFLDKDLKPEQPAALENYGYWVNEFHQELRNTLPRAFISSVVLATSPATQPWKRKTTLAELEGLAPWVDQLSFLYYDTGISDEVIFKNNCKYLVKDINTLKQKSANTQFLIAIGTFINHPALRKYRHLEIENIPNSLQIIKESIVEQNKEEELVSGIALFCDWQTDVYEWKNFYDNWGHFAQNAKAF